jgi:hypothetical protein
MKRILLMLTVAAFMVAVLTVTAAMAFAAPGGDPGPKPCEPGAPGCDTDKKQTKEAGASPGFNVTTTQRGQTTARGTQETETSTCTGPSGNELRPTHPHCS